MKGNKLTIPSRSVARLRPNSGHASQRVGEALKSGTGGLRSAAQSRRWLEQRRRLGGLRVADAHGRTRYRRGHCDSGGVVKAP